MVVKCSRKSAQRFVNQFKAKKLEPMRFYGRFWCGLWGINEKKQDNNQANNSDKEGGRLCGPYTMGG